MIILRRMNFMINAWITDNRRRIYIDIDIDIVYIFIPFENKLHK
jgi:hypothetical protein